MTGADTLDVIQNREVAVELYEGKTGPADVMSRLDVSGIDAHAADRAILVRIAAGDQGALGALYDRHGRSVFSLASRIVTDRGDAEDVVQDVFAQAWRQADRYDAARATVTGWLLMMTRARAIDRVRARTARPLTADDEMPDLPDPDPGQEAAAITSEAVARLQQALRDLPAAQRTALELAYYEGLTQADIAQKLREPLGTIKTRMRSALQKLRAVLQSGGAK